LLLILGLILAGCPTAVPAALKPTPPVQVFWYWGPPSPPPDVAALKAAGVTGIIGPGANSLHFQVQNGPLSLDDARADIKPLVDGAQGLPVWLAVGAVKQGTVQPPTPPRTFWDPADQAQRSLVLANLGNVSRAAKELGVAALGFDTESMVPGPQVYADGPAPQLRQIGADCARALRSNYGGVQLFALGPLAGAGDGFKKVWRGYAQEAGNLVFYSEDTYGLSGMDPKGVKRSLARCADITGAKFPAAGWFASTKAPNVPQWFQAATPQLQAAAKVSPYVLVYREGQMTPDQMAALGRTIRAVAN
jgi:hypothetical protein